MIDAALQISRADSSGTYVHDWRPIATHGRSHFVIESEEIYIDGVDAGPAFAPRVNWYVDDGEAVKPPPAAAAGKAH